MIEDRKMSDKAGGTLKFNVDKEKQRAMKPSIRLL